MADCTGRQHFLTLSDAPVIAGARSVPCRRLTAAARQVLDYSANASLLPLLERSRAVHGEPCRAPCSRAATRRLMVTQLARADGEAAHVAEDHRGAGRGRHDEGLPVAGAHF
jgi:hypothetical protein